MADNYTKLRAAIEAGPTPGQWVWREQGEANQHCMITTDKRWVIAFLQNGELLEGQQRINAEYVQAAQPEVVAALLAEIELLRADKARLDFMDKVAKRQGYDGFRLDYAIGDHEVLPGFLFHYRQRKENVGIRAVVDAALSAGGDA